MPVKEIKCDLLVIGAGLAGMAASLFAASRDIDTLQVGLASQLSYSSGLLDLLGVHPIKSAHVWDDPWAGITQLIQDQPTHPYAKLNLDSIRSAIKEFIAFMSKTNNPYVMDPAHNARVITPVGTIKTTYAVPKTMVKGVEAIKAQTPSLIIDFPGLKGYSAKQIIGTLGDLWPSLRPAEVMFPGAKGEFYGEQLARSLETSEVRKRLARIIKDHTAGVEAIGLPAVLGVYRPYEVLSDLESMIGLPLFEIPTMVPSVTGIRLRALFEHHLPILGVRTYYHNKVMGVETLRNGSFKLQIGGDIQSSEVLARSVILASGRFLGNGLHADRTGVRETIFNLPIYQPSQRAEWHSKDLFDLRGHPISKAGLMVDGYFRPVDEDGQLIYPNLYAAGSILAHQDWIRQKCGSGLAVSTAYGAICAHQAFSG